KFLAAFFCLNFSLLLAAEGETLFLSQEEVGLQLCLVPDLHEAISDLVRIRIDQHWHAGQYESIFPLFFLLSRIDPEDTDAWATGAWFLVNGLAPAYPKNRGKLVAKAAAFLQEGLAYHAQNYRLYWELAWLWYREGKLEVALKYLDEAEKFPHPFYVASTKAHILLALGKKEAAVAQWQLVAEKFPEQRTLAERFIQRLRKP
ncbi:MAG: hypothetical protein NC911_02380, partial [Candidatus Omnitrophica bacterium]|nr:hypothetical protein [Candidatus Omnitrophota bacterium]